MAVPPWGLVSLAELKRAIMADPQATGKDAQIEDAGAAASQLIAQACNRRLVYQGVLEDASSLVADTDLAGITFPITSFLAQPSTDWPYRTLAFQIEDPTYGLQLGQAFPATFTITGTDKTGAAQTETVQCGRGGVWWRGKKVFYTVTSIAASNLHGQVAGKQLLRVGTVKPYVDYASPELSGSIMLALGDSRFRMLDYDNISVIEYKEDINRMFDGVLPLVEGTDFLIEQATGEFNRVSGSFSYPLLPGIRTSRVTYSAGFADSWDKGNVPSDLRKKCCQLAARLYREEDRQMQGVSSRTDSAGATTRFSNATASAPDIQADVSTYMRNGYPANVERLEF